MQLIAAGLWPLQPTFKYIEDVFSTYLYTGTGASQTVTNGIDLSTKGGLVWTKCRSNETNNALFDTARGTTKYLSSNLTNAQATEANGITAFGTTGYTFGNNYDLNESTFTYASWTFREQPKFFDIVTYTGNGTVGRTVSHNLGSTPGCIIVKCTSAGSTAWVVYHRSVGATAFLRLNTTGASTTSNAPWNDTNPTSTQFTVDGVGGDGGTNASGATYVAYLFAHDAGGFGLTGTDNVISCGSFTTDSNGDATVNLGYEPQFQIVKRASGATEPWYMTDNMRGFGNTAINTAYFLNPNNSDSEGGPNTIFGVSSTGLVYIGLAPSSTYIYIAIRRGPMAVPTVGTSVFNPYVTTSVSNNGSGYGTLYNTGLVTDIVIQRNKSGTDGWFIGSRLQGARYMKTETTAAETSSSAARYDSNIGAWGYNASYGVYAFKRAPSVFDVVCYTGTGANRTVAHNLTVVPELMIVKRRSATEDWGVYSAPVGNTSRVDLNTTGALTTSINSWNDTSPTASVFTVGISVTVNGSGSTYVAYLFATCPGVSKVGGYTGTGTTLQIDCGFTAGARFVLIKRTDSTGDWYVWDSARGIVAGDDPYLLLNSAAAEVTNTDYVDTYSAGFEITSTAPAAINANGGTFIFLAIA
jgi:hypothetical protein